MKIHFGIFENCGNYESPLLCCEETLCGYKTEELCINSTNKWNEVNCKKCLKLKDNYIESEKVNEEAIVQQMGEIVDFFEELENNKCKN